MEKTQESSSSRQPPANAGFEDLLTRIAEGSDVAVWELLDRYSKNILRVVRRNLPADIRSKVDPADIVQSVWKSLLRKGKALEAVVTADQFIAYLAGMARLKVFETHRHFTAFQAFDVRREVNIESPPTGENWEARALPPLVDRTCQAPSSIVQVRDNWERALKKSGDRGQQIVQLRLQGLTHDEIADQLNLSKSTVRRVLQSLFDSLTL